MWNMALKLEEQGVAVRGMGNEKNKNTALNLTKGNGNNTLASKLTKEKGNKNTALDSREGKGSAKLSQSEATLKCRTRE